MKMTTFLMLSACLTASADGIAQKVTLSQKNVKLEKVFKEIRKQTGYVFFYDASVLKGTKPVNIHVKDASVEEALKETLAGQPLTFSIERKTITIFQKLNIQKSIVDLHPNIPDIHPKISLKIITGTVKDEDGNPLVGATILVKGTPNGTKSDINGNFTIDAEPNSTLVISFVGFVSTEVNIGDRTNVAVKLKPSVSLSEEVVVIGYGTQKKSSVTASISKVQNDILDQIPSGRMETALIGRMSGVNISTLRSTPGTAPVINVRGVNSISASNNPLVVIDGFPGGSLGQLDMNDVESIEVLKDASAAAIYGSRGAGGVILVTTKKGKSGKAVLSLNGYYGISQPLLYNDWIMGKEWYDYLVKYQNRGFVNAGGDITIPMFGDPRRPLAFQVNPLTYELPQTNWERAITQTAPMQNYNLSVRGGNENVRYYVSGTYSSEVGTLKTGNYETFSFRANLDVKINKVISLGIELNPYYTKRRTPGSTMLNLDKFPPFVPAHKVDGKYPRTLDYIPFGHSGNPSPYTLLFGVRARNTSFVNLANTFINFRLLDGLTFKTSLGTNISYNVSNNFTDGVGDPAVNVNGSVVPSNSLNLVNENVLSYTKTLNEVHDFGAILGASYQKSTSENVTMGAVTNSFNNDIVTTLNNATINPSISTQTQSLWGLISYFARVNYAYKNKYLFAASFRTDGSSRFGEDNKWGNFPSISGAWRVSQEDFMSHIPAISELKLRASYGVTGNFNIGDFQYLGAVGQVVYSPDNKTIQGIAQTSIENQKLSWEKVKGYDLGIELGLFNNRLNVVFDYYDKRTDGMLYSVNVPSITGFNSSIENIGVIRNRGIDVEINTKNLVGAFKWNTSFSISHNKNIVEDLGGVNERINTVSIGMDWLLRIGEPMFSYYGYKMIGVFQNMDQIASTPNLAGSLPGDPIVKDVNGDGKIDSEDRVILGNFQPKIEMGISNQFSWRKFDLSIFVHASLGAKIFNEESLFYQGPNLGALRRPLVENQWWSEDDPGDGKTPGISITQLYGHITNTDYYIESGSYLNISNLNLGYNLSNLVQNKGIKQLRVYTSISNLLIIKDKNNHAYNPEGATSGGISGINSTPGFNQGSEPINRTIVFGVNIGF